MAKCLHTGLKPGVTGQEWELGAVVWDSICKVKRAVSFRLLVYLGAEEDLGVGGSDKILSQHAFVPSLSLRNYLSIFWQFRT